MGAASVDERPSFTCPWCGSTSWHPSDVAEEYCGHCHVFVGDLELLEETPTAADLAREGLARPLDRKGAAGTYWVGAEGHEALGAPQLRNGRRGRLIEERRPAVVSRELPPPGGIEP